MQYKGAIAIWCNIDAVEQVSAYLLESGTSVFMHFSSCFFQDKVNFYASELGISRMHREKQKKKNDHHLFGIEAYGDYDYHHNFFEGAVNRDMRFWEPELVRNYTKMI